MKSKIEIVTRNYFAVIIVDDKDKVIKVSDNIPWAYDKTVEYVRNKLTETNQLLIWDEERLDE